MVATAYGKEIAKRLIDLEKTQGWLIEQVKDKTGLYFDGSYLYRLRMGEIHNPRFVQAINEILGIEEDVTR